MFSGIHTRFEHLLSHFGDVGGQDKWKSLIRLSDPIPHCVHQVQQLLKNRLISVSGFFFIHTYNI